MFHPYCQLKLAFNALIGNSHVILLPHTFTVDQSSHKPNLVSSPSYIDSVFATMDPKGAVYCADSRASFLYSSDLSNIFEIIPGTYLKGMSLTAI